MYEYRATVTRVVDADSIRASVDLGFSTWLHNVDIRLDGLDAPELPTEAGRSAKAALMLLLLNEGVGRQIILRTRKDVTEKFGRMLGTLILPALTVDGVTELNVNANDWLIAHGFARPYFGGKRE